MSAPKPRQLAGVVSVSQHAFSELDAPRASFLGTPDPSVSEVCVSEPSAMWLYAAVSNPEELASACSQLETRSFSKGLLGSVSLYHFKHV